MEKIASLAKARADRQAEFRSIQEDMRWTGAEQNAELAREESRKPDWRPANDARDMSDKELVTKSGQAAGTAREARYNALRAEGHSEKSATFFVQLREQETWRRDARLAGEVKPDAAVSRVADARMKQRMQSAATRAAVSMKQQRERSRDSGRGL